MSRHPSNRPTAENLDDLFTYHPPGGDQQERYQAIRSSAQTFAEMILVSCPDCADRSAAIRKIREAVMVANASIALEIEASS